MERGKDDGCEGETLGMGRSHRYRGSGASVLFKPLSRGEGSRKSSDKPWENWASRSDTLMRPETGQSFLSPPHRGQPHRPSSPGVVVCRPRAS